MRPALVLAALAALSGCASYTINGKNYSSREEALGAFADVIASDVSQIRAGSHVGGSCLVHLPPDDVLTNPPFTTRPIGRQEPLYAFFAGYYRQDADGVVAALRKAAFFDTVELKSVEGYESYARSWGYRFLMVNNGRGWELRDLELGRSWDLSGQPGLVHFAARVETALRSLRQAREMDAAGTSGKPSPPAEPSPAIAASDVDVDIPRTGIQDPDAIAVVIGNRNYKNKDIPSVDYASQDAETVKNYLLNVLGYKEGNIIYKADAGKADFESVFGTKDDYRGRLYQYLKKGKSNIFFYYSGHGAPDAEAKSGFFVPADADPQTIRLTGYPLEQLYNNIAKIAQEMAAPSVFIVVDACFSGASEKGLLLKNASPLVVTVASPVLAMPNAVVLTSARGDQISSWYPEKNHGLFTYFFLKAMRDGAKGEGLTAGALFSAVSDETEGVPYWARRLSGRIQTPQISGGKDRVLFKK